MSFNKNQLIEYIIKPVLNGINMYSPSSVNLLLGTAAIESQFGSYLYEFPNGPGKGMYSMEDNTYYDIFENYLKYDSKLYSRVIQFFQIRTNLIPDSERLIYDLRWSTALCRLHYSRFKEPLPDSDDLEGLANYWKKHYNTKLGKGTTDQFKKLYIQYVWGEK